MLTRFAVERLPSSLIFPKQRLKWEKLRGVNLERSTLNGTTILYVDLTESVLAQANLSNVVAPFTRFNDAVLYGAKLNKPS